MILKTNLLKLSHNDLQPESGRLLISEPFLNEIYFQRAVILMIEYTSEGAMGLVLNKSACIYLNDLLDELHQVSEKIPIYYGGPVHQDKLFYLHNLGELIPNSVKISEGLYIDGDFDIVKAYIRSGNTIEGHIRFFLGYSGWDYKQLQQEIEENAWLVAENRMPSLINQEGNQFWKDCLLTLDSRYQRWLNYPLEPFLN